MPAGPVGDTNVVHESELAPAEVGAVFGVMYRQREWVQPAKQGDVQIAAQKLQKFSGPAQAVKADADHQGGGPVGKGVTAA